MNIDVRGLAIVGLCLIFSSAGLTQGETQAQYFLIEVKDCDTGEGLSGVRLKTKNNLIFTSDQGLHCVL